MNRPSLYRLAPVCGRLCDALLAIVDLEFQVELLRRLRSSWALVPIWHGVVARWSREQKLLAQFSIPRSASLLPFPERAEWAVFAMWKIKSLLVRPAHVAIAHGHGLHAVPEEEVLHFPLDLRVRCYVRGNPPLNNCIGTVMYNHASCDFGRRLVVGAIQGDSADGIHRWLAGTTMFHLVLL